MRSRALAPIAATVSRQRNECPGQLTAVVFENEKHGSNDGQRVVRAAYWNRFEPQLMESTMNAPVRARHLYFVMSHKSPGQTVRLVKALLAASQDGIILLHHDPAGPALSLGELVMHPRLRLAPDPSRIRWSDFTMVEAFLKAMRWALRELKFDWLIWLSGQDYPLGTLDVFESALSRGTADGYFRYFDAIGHAGWPQGEGSRRYCYRYYDLPRNPYYYLLPGRLQAGLSALREGFVSSQPMFMIWPRQRNNPAKLGIRTLRSPFTATHPCRAGWMWLNVRRACIEYLVQFADANPHYVRHFRKTYCPEEAFPHTVLVNAKKFELSNQPLRHINWGPARFATSPDIITAGSLLDDALASGNPFARKFDQEVDAQPFEILDARIRNGIAAPCRLLT